MQYVRSIDWYRSKQILDTQICDSLTCSAGHLSILSSCFTSTRNYTDMEFTEITWSILPPCTATSWQTLDDWDRCSYPSYCYILSCLSPNSKVSINAWVYGYNTGNYGSVLHNNSKLIIFSVFMKANHSPGFSVNEITYCVKLRRNYLHKKC